MNCSIPLKRLVFETKLNKMIENNAPNYKIRLLQKKVDKLATKQQIAMIKYISDHKKKASI